MFDYDYYREDTPWSEYKEQITRPEVKEGVTSLGDYAPRSCHNLFTAELPNGLQRIESRAFSGCDSLQGISFSEALRRNVCTAM